MTLRRRRWLAGSSTVTPPALASISPALGDIYGGQPVTLTGTNMAAVTDVTFGGTAATSVVAVNATTVTCIAPAKAAGIYAVACSGTTGASNSLVSSYEAWHPTVDYAAARVYQADREVTSASSATRQRTGIQSLDIMVGATYGMYRAGPDPGPGDVIATGGTLACDGQGICELASGRILLAGGAPAGHAYQSVNTIWSSDDRCKTWVELCPDREASATVPAPGHTFGFFTLDIADTLWVYWLGGDPFVPTGDVFRILASELDVGGNPAADWTRISTTCPTSGLALFMYGMIGTDIYILGGQVDISDGAASKTVHKSTDYGATWSTLAAGSNCPADVWGAQLGPLPFMDSSLWVCGSARYDSVVNDFSNAVYKFDGATWTLVLAEDYVTPQFLPSRYHSCVLFGDRLWRINGTTWDGVTQSPDTRGVYYSADGVTWTEWLPVPSVPWNNTHAQAAIATSDGIYATDGFQTANVNVIREHTGALASAWDDQGSAALDLAQATDGKKPILDTTALGTQPGLVFTKEQALVLAAPDRDLIGEHYEAYFVGKFLDIDAAATEGPNPPGTVVGSSNSSSWNNAGFDNGIMTYDEYSGGYNSHALGATPFNDDVVRLYGFTHETAAIKAFAGITQQGSTVITSTFDTSFTGWDAIGGGYSGTNPPQDENDHCEIVLGAVVVLGEAAAAPASFRTKLATWAIKWGVEAPSPAYAVPPSAPVGILPAEGVPAGGTSVSIEVDDSTGIISAAIGGVDLTSFTIVDGTHVSGDTPAGLVGPHDVTVTDGTGTSAPLSNGFRYDTGAFDPLSVGAPLLWLDASVGVTGDPVTDWDDQSGGTMAVTITGGKEPDFTASNANYAGAPTVDCGTAQGVFLNSTGLTNAPFTVVFVGDGTDSYWFNDGGGNYLISAGGGSGNKIQISADAGGTLLTGTTVASGIPGVYVCAFDGVSSRIYSTKLTPGATGSSGTQGDLTATQIAVGGSYDLSGVGMAGSIRHFMIFDGALSDADCEFLINGFASESNFTVGA